MHISIEFKIKTTINLINHKQGNSFSAIALHWSDTVCRCGPLINYMST